MSFFLTFGLLVTIMITFCVKKTHSLTKENNSSTIKKHDENDLATILFPTFNEPKDYENPKVIESSSHHHPLEFEEAMPSTISNDGLIPIFKNDPGGLGFLDEVGGSVDGLMSCTESLGFESSDERRVDDHNLESIDDDNNREFFSRKVKTKTAARIEPRTFPPPLSSLNYDGKPNFFFKSVRRDGRLELTEVKIDRTETLRASREDGRLRLHLVQELEQDEEEEEEENDEVEDNKNEDIIEEEREEKWIFPAMTRRCHEAVTRHHHHDMHGWRQPCVVIR